VDGSYVLLVRQEDLAGNVSLVGSSEPFVIDNTPPSAPLVAGSNGAGQTASVLLDADPRRVPGHQVHLRAGHNGVVGTFADCTSPFTVPLTAEGTYRVDVYAL
jgi:hypothetical protein